MNSNTKTIFPNNILSFYDNGNIKMITSFNDDKLISNTKYTQDLNLLSVFTYYPDQTIKNIKLFNKSKEIVYELIKDNNDTIETINIDTFITIKLKLINGKLNGNCIMPVYNSNDIFKTFLHKFNIENRNINGNDILFITEQSNTYENVEKFIINIDLLENIYKNNDLKLKEYHNVKSKHYDNTKYNYFMKLKFNKFDSYIDCNFINNKLTGEYKLYKLGDNNKKYIIITNYCNGKLNGKHETFYDNGNHNIICNYVNNNLHGKYEEFYDDNTCKIICNYVKNVLHGKYEKYYPNGKLHISCEYIIGELNNEYKEYYDSGLIHKKCNYIRGILDGISETHTLQSSTEYYNNVFNTKYLLTLINQNSLLYIIKTEQFNNNISNGYEEYKILNYKKNICFNNLKKELIKSCIYKNNKKEIHYYNLKFLIPDYTKFNDYCEIKNYNKSLITFLHFNNFTVVLSECNKVKHESFIQIELYDKNNKLKNHIIFDYGGMLYKCLVPRFHLFPCLG